MLDKGVLRQYQSLPLEAKVHMSQARIREWYEHFDGNVYVSFSGGKDSTVLADIVREYYPNVPLVFCNTGLEYPEIQSFANRMGADIITPKMSFSEVISKYGYPVISKESSEAIYVARRIRNGSTPDRVRKGSKIPWVIGKRQELVGTSERIINNSKDGRNMYSKTKWLPLCHETQFKISDVCCEVMKKRPMHEYQSRQKRYPFVATLAEESRLREQAWYKHGCNSFDAQYKSSQPMSFWTEQDVLKYIVDRGLETASVYGNIVCIDSDGMEYDPLPGIDCKMKCTGCDRTGCVYCAYGAHLTKGKERFIRLAETHPRQYEYCLGGGQWVDNPDYDPAAPKMDGDWENWNPKKIWVPSKKGLGMKHVFDEMNALYGKGFIEYE